MNSTQPPPQSPLIRAPEDIRLLIYPYLSNGDIKNLRLVSSFFGYTVCPRLARVFISANPTNVEVFEAISQHDGYRAQVKEIIWDEALLVSGPENEECPQWYRTACRENSRQWDEDSLEWRSWLEPGTHYTQDDPLQIGCQLPLEESWAYYRSLLRQQQEVLDSRAHIRAFESAIGRFPALRKITITDAAHGQPPTPLYETPMIRAFPDGFNYALPSCRQSLVGQSLTCNWDETGKGWDGFRAVIHLLAQNLDSGKVTELDIRSSSRYVDLSKKPCQTLADFQTVLWRANFESLHLDLGINQDDGRGRSPFERVSAGAEDEQGLRKLTLRANIFNFPLRSMFNPNSLQRVRHINLAHFVVDEYNLLAVLRMLPRIRSININRLRIYNGNYGTLLCQIRDTLGWQDRIPRPHISFVLDQPGFGGIMPRSKLRKQKGVHEFLYEGGLNPFFYDQYPSNF
ncbi:hypothetical protein F4680DRAFT_468176 [Xylaria scruposa]|nr:hypothetical protein F4680DRAFT_468176 [Xylaria scruposa]